MDVVPLREQQVRLNALKSMGVLWRRVSKTDGQAERPLFSVGFQHHAFVCDGDHFCVIVKFLTGETMYMVFPVVDWRMARGGV